MNISFFAGDLNDPPTTGALPTISLDGHQYYFIAYNYNSNYIFVEPIKDVKDTTLVEAFQQVFETLEDRGMKLMLNITDNQEVKPTKADSLMPFKN